MIAPATSNNMTTLISNARSRTAPNAGPPILQIDWIAWLIPAIRVSSFSGASNGIDDFIAGEWNEPPMERSANNI